MKAGEGANGACQVVRKTGWPRGGKEPHTPNAKRGSAVAAEDLAKLAIYNWHHRRRGWDHRRWWRRNQGLPGRFR